MKREKSRRGALDRDAAKSLEEPGQESPSSTDKAARHRRTDDRAALGLTRTVILLCSLIITAGPARPSDRSPAASATSVNGSASMGSAADGVDDRTSYRIEGETVTLEPIQDRLAVFYVDGTDDAARLAIAQRLGLSTRAIDTERLPSPVADVYTLRSGENVGALERGAKAEGAVRHASRVYRWSGVEVVPTGEVFVQLPAGASEEVLDQILSLYPLDLVERTSWKSGNFLLRLRSGSDQDLLELCRTVDQMEGVAACEPNLLQRLPELSPATDPLFPQQWNLHNDGAGIYAEDCDLDAPEGWEIPLGVGAVTIAILDEGVQAHPDYQRVAGWDFPGADADASPTNWDDHGTKCAGAAAAYRDNGLGAAGVASGLQAGVSIAAKVMPIRIAYSPSPGANWVTTTAWLAGGIAWAYEHGADVLSNSWGGGPPSSQIRSAIRAAVTDGRSGLGSVVVFAAGNDNVSPPSYPGIYPETICVVATTPCDQRKEKNSPSPCQIENWGSNYGPGSDVSAPGVLIATTTNGGGYVTNFNGTSSATPQVAGLAALLIAKYPFYLGTEIRSRIEQTCDKVGGYSYDATTGVSNDLGHGRVNLYRALTGKPQVILGPVPENASVYRDASDPSTGYPSAEHESAAYEWLGDEYSPERAPLDLSDPDGPANGQRRDGFDDGVDFVTPYVPSQTGTVLVRISVEDWNSVRYRTGNNPNLYLNVWFDWKDDGSWNQPEDWMVQNKILTPNSWGTNVHDEVITFTVPDFPIGWHIQSAAAGRFLNVRTRLTYQQPLPASGASVLATWGEVEDDRILNFVEMFDLGVGYMTTAFTPCDPWTYVSGTHPDFPASCPPVFVPPDAGDNGFMANCSDFMSYAGDEMDGLRTPSFNLTELTEAWLEFDHSAIEAIQRGRLVLYKNGLVHAVLLPSPYSWIQTSIPDACSLVFHQKIDLTPYCGDGWNDVMIAFESDHDEPCGIPFPSYQDWIIDNVIVHGQDRIKPGMTTVTVTPSGPNSETVTWIAPGDDGMIRQAELFNLRYGPEIIGAHNWRHSLWVRRDMAGGIPTPGVPGTLHTVNINRLSGGLHHVCVRTMDEVNWISDIADGGTNNPPTINAGGPYTVEARSGLTFAVTGSDPDFDPLFLLCLQKPSGATFQDHGDNTGEFTWTPGPADVGSHTAEFRARDWNGSATDVTVTIQVIEQAPPNRGACCLTTPGCCEIMTAAKCAQESGAFQGVGSVCDPNPCAPVAPDLATHNVGAIRLTVTDRGILGFLDNSQQQGQGLIYPTGGQNHLFTGGLWVGGAGFVANRDFDTDPDKDWAVMTCPDGRVQTTVQGAKQTIRASYNDDLAITPVGLQVEQESWSLSSPASDDDFVVFRATIVNTGTATLTDLYAGVVLDLDLRTNGLDDQGAVDASRSLAYLTDPSGIHVGLRALTDNGSLPIANLTLIHNPTFVWPNQYIEDEDKKAFLMASDPPHVMTASSIPNDHSLLASFGPFDLGPSQVRDVAFAIIGGSSLAGFQANADRAQTVWFGGQPSDAPSPATAAAALSTRILPNQPNPFAAETALRFELPQAGTAELLIFDASGRRVRNLSAGPFTAGIHEVVWNGRDDAERTVAAGIYFVTLRTNDRELSRPIVRAR